MRIDASWEGDNVTVNTSGITEFRLRWLSGSTGAATGSEGDEIHLTVNGTQQGPLTLTSDATVAVADYCRYSDVSRLWSGKLDVVVVQP